MPRFPLTPPWRSTFALIAVLATAGIATYLIVRDGAMAPSCSRPGAGSGDTFEICGDLHRPLVPGASQPIDMRISNPTRRRLRITRITVSLRLDAAHTRAGCSRARSFRVTGLKPTQYPILVPARSTRSLRALGLQPLPRVSLRHLPVDQDACKGAQLDLRYQGRAQRRLGWP